MLTLPSQVILIPGLFEPHFTFLPLKWSVAKYVSDVQCWRDRHAFRDLKTSVERFSDAIVGDAAQQGAIGVVTHSFGDWVARAALANCPQHRVTTMVSLAPVMRAGFLPSLLYGLTGKLIPEIEVIMNPEQASTNLDCDDRVRRLVIWSRFDESLRSVPLDEIPNLQVQRVWATHLSIAWQPQVFEIIKDFMQGDERGLR